MKKRMISLFLFLLLLTGCGTSDDPQGIYYPALSHTFISNNLDYRTTLGGSGIIHCGVPVSSLPANLYYDDSIYSQVGKYTEYSKKDLPLEELLGKELGTVFGHEAAYWSVEEEKLASCTHTGTLYQLNGYDETFRVGLYFEQPADVDAGQGPTYHLCILERTNNITLRTGRDYYTDLFHFPENTTLNNLDIKDGEVAAFVDALLDAELINPAGADVPAFDYTATDDIYYISFTDSLGITNSIEIYESGYVVDKKDHTFILKLEPELCRAVIDKIHEPEWVGNYFYNTYTYDNTRNIRTRYTYRLEVTETDTHLNFDLQVEQSDTPLSGNYLDVLVIGGPTASLSISKEELGYKHVISFVSRPFPENAPELITYIELKKGTEEDVIYLRYADTKEELAEENYVVLNKQ